MSNNDNGRRVPRRGNGSSVDGFARHDIARLGHELRTPLSAISVLAEIMRDERLGPLGSPKYRAYAADIHQSAAHANAVLAGWLEADDGVSETGGALEFVELESSTFVSDAVAALAPLAACAGVALVTTVAPGSPHLIADRRSLRQILNNLIANSVRFTPPGGRIDVRVCYAPARELTIEIADNGDGMSPAELERALSARPIPEALRLRSGGTGMGLPLVRSLAAAGGAVIRIASTLGHGTTVTIAFGPGRILPV